MARLQQHFREKVAPELVKQFGKLFYNVAGKPQTIDQTRSRLGQHRYYVAKDARELLTAEA